MNRLISLIILAGGVVLIIYGARASDSIGSRFSRLFNGAPTDQTLWLLIGGVVVVALGLGGLLRGSKS